MYSQTRIFFIVGSLLEKFGDHWPRSIFMFQNNSIHFIELVKWFPTREEFLPGRISTDSEKKFPHFKVHMISILLNLVHY